MDDKKRNKDKEASNNDLLGSISKPVDFDPFEGIELGEVPLKADDEKEPEEEGMDVSELEHRRGNTPMPD